MNRVDLLNVQTLTERWHSPAGRVWLSEVLLHSLSAEVCQRLRIATISSVIDSGRPSTAVK
jgi:hypothetical protein